MFRYIYWVLSLKHSNFCDYVDCIYPTELEIKDTTDKDKSASYLYHDIHLNIDNKSRFRMKLYDKMNDFNFPFVFFLFICCIISAVSEYGTYISQLKRYSRACGFYHEFLDRRLLLTRKLQNQE